MGYNIHEHKRYYYTFDNSLLFTEHSEYSHKSFHANFIIICSSKPHWALGIPQYVYALNPVCTVLIIPGHSRREVPRQAG